MELIMLGTGSALVTECYNTCFAISENNRVLMVDGGGGNTILSQLKKAGIKITDIHDIFVTHKHMDHIIGVVWIVKVVCQLIKTGFYIDNLYIYGHGEVINALRSILLSLLNDADLGYIGNRVCLVEVYQGQSFIIFEKKFTFFDIYSSKEKQFGFFLELDFGNKLTCCGDEPLHSKNFNIAMNSKWLLLEAFCLSYHAENFRPYDKHHSTVADSCKVGSMLGVRNLILYHMEDLTLPCRKKLYMDEGRKFYKGNLFVPDDLDRFIL